MDLNRFFATNRNRSDLDHWIHSDGTYHHFEVYSIELEKSSFDPLIDPEHLDKAYHVRSTREFLVKNYIVNLKCAICGFEVTANELAAMFIFTVTALNEADKEIQRLQETTKVRKANLPI